MNIVRLIVGARGGCLAMAWLAMSASCLAAFSLTSSTTAWTKISYTGTQQADYFSDQQTGLKSGDLVGNTANCAFYTHFDDAGTPSLTDGTLSFRIRLSEAKNYTKLVFDYNLFVGMDVNRDGALDLFVGVDNQPNGTGALCIWQPGTGANTSPSTTTVVNPPTFTAIEDATNYSFVMVNAALDPTATSFDIDANGKTDTFLSFSINFAQILTALGTKATGVNQNSDITYVMATATQSNSLNMDLNGVSGAVTSTQTWAQLGAESNVISLSGSYSHVPEPATLALLAMGGLGVFSCRRRK